MTSLRQQEGFIAALESRIAGLVNSARQLPVLGILVRAALSDQRHLSKDMAASMAYFTFLSLFPLFLGLFALGGTFLESADVQARLNDFLARADSAESSNGAPRGCTM